MADETPELGKLSELAQRSIDAELRRPDADDAMQARLFARIAGTIAVGGAVGAAAGTAAAATKGGAVAATATGGAAAAATATGTAAGVGTAAGAATGTGLAVGVTLKTIPWLVLAFAAGGGTGAAIHARVAMPEVPPMTAASVTATAAPAAPVPVPVPVPEPTSAISLAPPEPSRTPVALPARTSAPSSSPDVALAAERALIERARMALARGQSGAALEAVDAHAKGYPRGRLAEEREAIAVQALVQGGRTADARARADRFRATYPNSVFGAAVDTVVPPK